MELIGLVVLVGVIGYLLLGGKKKTEETVVETPTVNPVEERLWQQSVAKIEQEVKAEVVEVATKAKTTARKAKAKVAEVEQEVVTAVKKARKPRTPKA